MRRRSAGSILISNLDPGLKDRILNLPIRKDVLKKFEEEERREEVSCIVDLRELSTRTETEVYNTLNRMFKNQQFFMYCGPLLLNINPGPNYVNDYLNLQKWMKETEKLPDTRWKPHLYAFVNYVYQTLIRENKDQVINMLGQIGSGKTFNLVHIIEYLCYIAGKENYEMEIFDVSHKAIQLVHILGSIFRQNNMESSSCGMLLRLGFNEEHKICNFDLEAKILDFTLPFSENGRSFSILHALMIGANSEIKKLLELPEKYDQLNFFRKFAKNFDHSTRERFKLNDLEIWNRFHTLLNNFKFTKNEILEILNLFAFILLCNEAAIGKKKVGKLDAEEFCITKGISSKKLSKVFGMSEEDFLKKFGTFKNLNDIKNTLISLMKHTYYIIFEFVKEKIRSYLRGYFERLTGMNLDKSRDSNMNHSFSNSFMSQMNIKYINFIDFPGEVEDQTLGGFSTNLANECLNVFAGSQYLSVVEKLEEEKLNLKYFQPLHSYYIVESLLGPSGMFKFLSNPFTEENFRRLQKKVKNKDYYRKTTMFNENLTTMESEFHFNFKFSHMNMKYNYESLYMETKSLVMNKSIMSLLAASKNSIIKSTYKSVLVPQRTFYSFTIQNLREFFRPLEGLSPFVIYCLHSNNSLKIFFGEKYMESRENWDIPLNLTVDMLKNSLMIPVLFWEWFGFHEWVDVNQFVNEFAPDFEKIKERIVKMKGKQNIKDVPFNKLNPFEIATYILSVLGSNKSYLLGANHVILKKGTIKEVRKVIDSMLEMMKNTPNMTRSNSQTGRRASNIKSQNTSGARSKSILSGANSQNLQKRNSTDRNIRNPNGISNSNSKKNIPGGGKRTSSSGKDLTSQGGNYNNSNTSFSFQPPRENNNNPQPGRGSIFNQKASPERKQSMKVQCHLNFIDDIKNVASASNLLMNTSNTGNMISMPNNMNNAQSSIYNIYKLLHNATSKVTSPDNSREHIQTTENEVLLSKYNKDNNIITTNKNYFNAFKKLFDYSNSQNFEVFDYSEHLSEVSRLQNCFRAFKARKKYKIYRYVIKRIQMMQRFIRGVLTRKKFKKFVYCHNCIVFIQRLYKMRHEHKNRCIIKIQALWRAKLAWTKLLMRLEKRQSGYYEAEDEEDENNRRFANMSQNSHRLDEFEAELLNVSMNKQEVRRKSQKMLQQKSRPLSLVELEKETDKDKIIEHLLLDQTLVKANDSLLLNNKTMMDKSGMSTKLRHSITQVTQNKKRNIPRGKRVEDKLIEYGENLKLKKAEAKLEKIKKEEEKFSFKPVTKTSGLDVTRHGGADFLQRVEYYKNRQEKKIEEIRNKNVDPSLLEYTFRPQVSDLARSMRRNMNDLFYWKQKRDDEVYRKKQDKDEREMEQIEKSIMMPKINRNSEMLLKQKMEKSMIEKMNQQPNADEYDLWPVNMEKNYFEK